MAHHYESLPDEMRHDGRRLGLGATGSFPEGVVNDLDEGEIQFGISSDIKRQKVFINFGKPVEFLGMNYDQAMAMSNSLRDKANQMRGITV